MTPANSGSLASIVSSHSAGTTFCLAQGVYRLTATVKPQTGDSFVGSGSGSGGTELRGDVVLSGWSYTGGLYVHSGGVSSPKLGGRCAGGGKTCQYSDDVYSNGKFLHRVLSPCSSSRVVSGSYCIDYSTKKVYLHDNPSGKVITHATVPSAFLGATGVHLSNMAITHFADPAHNSAAVMVDTSSVANDLVVAYNHSEGIRMNGTNPVVENSHIYDNGQEGASSWVSSGGVFANNEVDHNNVMNFDASWEGGGAKFADTSNLTIANNHFHDNFGSGVWLDIDNSGAKITGNVSQNNMAVDGGGDGIRIEVSCNTTITNNSLTSNGRHGISISDSHSVTVGASGAGNTVTGNHGAGVWVIATGRVEGRRPLCHPSGGVYPETNDVVSYNTIQLPGGSQVGFSIHTGVSTSGSKFVANTYTSASGCGSRTWKPLANRNKATGFSGWQSTGQDPAPGGHCS